MADCVDCAAAEDGECPACRRIREKLFRRMKGVRVLMDLRCSELWCRCCDEVKVSSDDPSTGTFYMVAGWRVQWPLSEAGGQGQLVDDWQQVVWAVCSRCEKED